MRLEGDTFLINEEQSRNDISLFHFPGRGHSKYEPPFHDYSYLFVSEISPSLPLMVSFDTMHPSYTGKKYEEIQETNWTQTT